MKNILRISLFLILGLIFLAALFYWYKTKDLRNITEKDRKEAPWSFAKLPSGITHYELVGADTASLVVLLGGCGTGAFIFDSNMQALTKEGFKVLRYEYYGRGLSDHPRDVDFNHDYYNTQLNELLDHLKLNDPFHLMGVSMGGNIAIDYTSKFENKVKSLILVGPAALGNKPNFLLKIPIVSSFLMDIYWAPRTEAQQISEYYNPEKFIKKYEQEMKKEIAIKNFTYAIKSSWLHLLNVKMIPQMRKIAVNKTPVLMLWGDSDPVIPIKLSRFYLEANPQILFVPIKNSGHIANYENHKMCNSLLGNFMRNSNTY